MKKIASFKINHKLLNPGIYVSRVDKFGKTVITTFDIRMKKPNVDEPMKIEAMHTIEHIGATYLRNHPKIKNKVVYFGPMGCQTGFYLVIQGDYPLYRKAHKELMSIIMDMFQYIVDFKDKKHIPGATAEECGNYKSQDLNMAHAYAANMLVMGLDFMLLGYEYPTGDVVKDKESHIRQEIYINREHDRDNIKDAKKRGYDVSNLLNKKSDNSAISRWEDDSDPYSKNTGSLFDLTETKEQKAVDSSAPLF